MNVEDAKEKIKKSYDTDYNRRHFAFYEIYFSFNKVEEIEVKGFRIKIEPLEKMVLGQVSQ